MKHNSTNTLLTKSNNQNRANTLTRDSESGGIEIYRAKNGVARCVCVCPPSGTTLSVPFIHSPRPVCVCVCASLG